MKIEYMKKAIFVVVISLNPYSNGMKIEYNAGTALGVVIVLILILME